MNQYYRENEKRYSVLRNIADFVNVKLNTDALLKMLDGVTG